MTSYNFLSQLKLLAHIQTPAQRDQLDHKSMYVISKVDFGLRWWHQINCPVDIQHNTRPTIGYYNGQSYPEASIPLEHVGKSGLAILADSFQNPLATNSALSSTFLFTFFCSIIDMSGMLSTAPYCSIGDTNVMSSRPVAIITQGTYGYFIYIHVHE